MSRASVSTSLLDLEPTESSFREEVLEGLSQPHKRLPCKYFYDQRGSQLFDRLCELDEYYLTRTELAIMEQHAADMAACIGRDAAIVELGSGSSIKTRLLLDEVVDAVAYVPVDISREHLQDSADRLNHIYTDLDVLPVCTDFTERIELPSLKRHPRRCIVYFPGSTIGNFTREQAQELIHQIGDFCGDDGGLLIGIDLQKDQTIIEAAYNDAEGVTDEFNLNLLRRINHELDGDFDLDAFQHRAVYVPSRERVEIFLVSDTEQTVTIGDEVFQFDQGEAICTEYSHKYTISGFAKTAAEAGFTLRASWTDSRNWFAVLYLQL